MLFNSLKQLFLNNMCIFERFLSIPHLVDNSVGNLDKRGRNIICHYHSRSHVCFNVRNGHGRASAARRI